MSISQNQNVTLTNCFFQSRTYFSITDGGQLFQDASTRGIVKVNDEIEIVGIKEETQKAAVTGVEMFRNNPDEGLAGDNVGVLLRGVQRDEIERGQAR